MISLEVIRVLGSNHELAESPGWNPETKEFFWVDIARGTLHWLPHNQTGSGRWAKAPAGATSMKWVRGREYLVTGQRGIYRFNQSGFELIWQSAAASTNWRFNDSLLLPDGQLLAGTKSDDRKSKSARVGYLQGSEFVWWDIKLGLANGIAFDSSRSRLYIADSWANQILWWETNNVGLPLDPSNPSPLVTGIKGEPDGIVLDKSGNLLVAIWGQGQIQTYSPEGSLLCIYETGVELTSSLAFAGIENEMLVITSAVQSAVVTRHPNALRGGDVILAKLP